MKLRGLERILEELEGIETPRADLEQYHTPAVVAARLVYHAFMRGDIQGRRVCDLGCGSGILACGAALLGAVHVLGVDIDPGSITIARRNAARIGKEIEFRIGDIAQEEVFAEYSCDTVVMNPPFGAQRRHADRPFLDRALTLGAKVYGIFNAGSLPFVTSYIAGRAIVEEVIQGTFPLRRTFAFHTRELREIEVEILCLKTIA
jgi:putative methylase